MPITLDAQTEQRIQREIDLGHYREPAEVINRALDLLEAQEAWSEEEQAELDAHLAESMAQIERGEGIPGDQVRARLAELRAARVG